MVKKFIALFVSLIFAFSLGIASAAEENGMPWEPGMQTPAKKEAGARQKIKKTNKKRTRKAAVRKARKTNTATAVKAGGKKTGKKEPEKKKWYKFW